MKNLARFLFVRAALFFVGLAATRAWGFSFFAEALFAAIGILLLFKPFRPFGYPVAYGVLIVVSAVTIRWIESDAAAAAYGFIASAILCIFERVRFRKVLDIHFHQQLLPFGYAAVYTLACGIIFFLYPGSLNFFAQGIIAISTFVLAYECVIRGGAGSPAPGRRGLILMGSGAYALLFTEISWALALLPIGYINGAGILGAAFFFSMDVFLLSLRHALNRNTLLVYSGIFVCVVAVILGLSQWTI